MDAHDEAKFQELVRNLSDIENPEIAIDLLSISQVIERLNEAALFLGQYVSKVIAVPRDTPVEFPDPLLTILPSLSALAEEAADIMHAHICEQCNKECDCEDDDCEHGSED